MPRDWPQRLQEIPYGSPEALDLVMLLSDAAQLGLVNADQLDRLCHKKHLDFCGEQAEPLTIRDTLGQQAAREQDRLRFLDRVNPLPVTRHYTMKEIRAMKLSEALKAIRSVSLEDITAELKEAEASFEVNTKGAKEAMQAEIRSARNKYKEATKAARADIKMLQRLKMSKEKSGKPLKKKGCKK